ncbi:MAG: prephenate dehydrogenase/arogenate dehydrogenase family protein [Lachnospira sp.]|nr:prephenate dehydrogenase/arogenate dehydrogenase family protein [Lachnospira sp.]
MSFNHIGFIGFGLIGGSIARAVKQSRPECTITVLSRSLTPLEEAVKDGVVNHICTEIGDSFAQCDLILICTPVVSITEYLSKLKPVISNQCLITDVGSVKGYIHDAVKALDMEQQFIGGHPMAGSQLTGYANSSAEMMAGAKYIITPTAKSTTEQVKDLEDFILEIKSEPVVMDVETHDISVAGISHVPHLSACALTNMVQNNDNEQHYMHMLAAGGFKDTTRIAASSPEMWEQICATNGKAISLMLSKYIDILTEMKAHIDSKTPGYIENAFAHSREYRNTFDE